MYIKKYDYEHHPEYHYADDYLKLYPDYVDDLEDASYPIFKTFMKIWMFKTCRKTGKWRRKLSRFVKRVPVILPRRRMMSKTMMMKFLSEDEFVLDDKHLESEKIYYSKYEYPDLVVRAYCKKDFARKFREAYFTYLDRFVDRLIELSGKKIITSSDIGRILKGIIVQEESTSIN